MYFEIDLANLFLFEKVRVRSINSCSLYFHAFNFSNFFALIFFDENS